jgi:hypothetical protein
MTKSGQIGAKDAFSWSVKEFHRSSLTQEASGDRLRRKRSYRVAPFGKVKPALESKVSPVLSWSAQLANC